MRPFTWENCFADVQTCKHDLTTLPYLDDLIRAAGKRRGMADKDVAVTIQRLWRMPRPDPNNVISRPAFEALSRLAAFA